MRALTQLRCTGNGSASRVAARRIALRAARFGTTGPSAFDFAMNAYCAAASRARGPRCGWRPIWPTRVKNSSWPLTQAATGPGRRRRCGNACGELAETLIVSPAPAVRVLPRNVTSTSPSRTVDNLLEVVAVGRRTAAGQDLHVDERVGAVRVVAGDQDRVRVTDQASARQRPVLVRSGWVTGYREGSTVSSTIRSQSAVAAS